MGKRKLGRGLDVLISRGGRRAPEGEGDRAEESRPEGGAEVGRRGNGGGRREAGPQGAKGKVDVKSSKGREPPAEKVEEPRGEELRIRQLSPAEIDLNPAQPRKRFSAEELESLKQSVSQEGVLQPVLVREKGGRYQLVAGERRWRAAQELGLESIPARVIEIPEKRLLELALIENIHRANLNPIELAEAYRHLLQTNQWTQGELSEKLGIGRSNIANTVRLLDLPADMQEALSRNQISPGHAKVLLSISDAQQQRAFFERIAEENLSVRELEEVRQLEGGGDGPEPRRKKGKRSKGRGAEKKPYIISLEEELAEVLGTRVQIREHGGKGVLSIEFYSKDDFDRLRSILLSGSDNS